MKVFLTLILTVFCGSVFAVDYTVDPSATTWPIQAKQPNDYDIDRVIINGDHTSKGQLNIKKIAGGQYQPVTNVEYSGGGKVVNLYGYELDGCLFNDLDIGYFQLRHSDNCVISDCNLTGQLRVRYSSNNNTIERCHVERHFATGATIPPGDVAGIYFSDGPKFGNTVRDCEIINFTDGIQVSPGIAQAEAMLIERVNVYLSESIAVQPGSEEAFDFKSGGSAAYPLIIRDCTCIGMRSNQTAGGYAVTIHNDAEHLIFDNVTFADCESGVFLNRLNVNDPTLYVFNNCKFLRIKSHSTWFPQRSGYAVTGSMPATFNSCVFMDNDNDFGGTPTHVFN